MARLRDRYELNALLPEDVRRAELLTLIDRLCPGGSIHHVLWHIPEQAEDVYTILVDDHSVVSFDVPRGRDPMILTGVRIQSFRQFRNEIGQGKDRIRLDGAAERARKLLGSTSVPRG
ncbi:hypothetical protein ACQR1V_19415 [Bradyrhizobium oligotrophicum]|uniref:hypothetical protein n=1 Tax=Bradyrhizobium oligotrophicum TaxID=44255 RepID=UPI003EB90AF4